MTVGPDLGNGNSQASADVPSKRQQYNPLMEDKYGQKEGPKKLDLVSLNFTRLRFFGDKFSNFQFCLPVGLP